MGRALLILAIVVSVISISQGQGTTNICANHRKCGECLQSPGCVWCSDPKFLKSKSNLVRCNTEQGHNAVGQCTQEYWIKLSSPTETSKPSTGDIIKPASYNVKLGVGQKINITLDYTDPGNKPLDLYYLMDLSATMEKHKGNVQKLGTELAAALLDTTDDLQLGFGSFIDKPLMPYATKSDIAESTDGRSVPTYGFLNHLRLTKDTEAFEKAVKEAKISRNLDAPEGGLDAIMQAIECKDVIGWRNGSRRVLVVSTDGSFHIAGDGKLAGLVIPHDGKCNMDNNYYSKSTVLDYPSVFQVISKIRERQTHIIFAVTKDQVPLYKELSLLVPDYSTTKQFDSNAKEIIQDQYRLIRGTVELSASKLFPSIQLKYFAKCGSSETFVESNKCTGIGPESSVTFKIQIELLKCPTDSGQWVGDFDIAPTGSTSGEKLSVNLNLACGCACEEERGEDVLKSPGLSSECSNNGTVRCGICHCKNPSIIGEFCQCSTNGTETSLTEAWSDKKCRQTEDSSVVCSGRGKCECGVCKDCKDGYNGQYCECYARACVELGSMLECSGPDKGTCGCGVCSCKDGFNGTFCECDKSERNCKREGEDASCNAHGECDCNQCKCNSDWGGKYCDICISSNRGKETCECSTEIQKYITCAIQDTAENSTVFKMLLKPNYKSECYKREESMFDPLEMTLISTQDFNVYTGKRCIADLETEFSHRKHCKILFAYELVLKSIAESLSLGSSRYYKESLKIVIQDKPECNEITPPPTLPIVVGTSVGVVFIGILTLILWKIITFIHDRREYSRFEKERRGAKWDASGNPLYSEPISTFQNPAFHNQ